MGRRMIHESGIIIVLSYYDTAPPTKFSLASGMTSIKAGKVFKAPSPALKTTRLWRIRSLLWRFTPWSANVFSSASAALPLYNRKWLQALRLTATEEPGKAYHYTTEKERETKSQPRIRKSSFFLFFPPIGDSMGTLQSLPADRQPRSPRTHRSSPSCSNTWPRRHWGPNRPDFLTVISYRSPSPVYT